MLHNNFSRIKILFKIIFELLPTSIEDLTVENAVFTWSVARGASKSDIWDREMPGRWTAATIPIQYTFYSTSNARQHNQFNGFFNFNFQDRNWPKCQFQKFERCSWVFYSFFFWWGVLLLCPVHSLAPHIPVPLSGILY